MVFDLDFYKDEKRDIDKAVKSLAKQLGYCYYYMRNTEEISSIPSVHLSSYTGRVAETLSRTGALAWKVHRHEGGIFDTFEPHNLVYLSPDASEVLEVTYKFEEISSMKHMHVWEGLLMIHSCHDDLVLLFNQVSGYDLLMTHVCRVSQCLGTKVDSELLVHMHSTTVIIN